MLYGVLNITRTDRSKPICRARGWCHGMPLWTMGKAWLEYILDRFVKNQLLQVCILSHYYCFCDIVFIFPCFATNHYKKQTNKRIVNYAKREWCNCVLFGNTGYMVWRVCQEKCNATMSKPVYNHVRWPIFYSLNICLFVIMSKLAHCFWRKEKQFNAALRGNLCIS